MLSQHSAPLLNPVEWANERDQMTRQRSELRGEMDRAKLFIDDCDTVDEDEGPCPAAVVKGEKLQ